MIGVNATDMFDHDAEDDEYDEEPRLLPTIEISSMNINQSIDMPLTNADTANIGGNMSTQVWPLNLTVDGRRLIVRGKPLSNHFYCISSLPLFPSRRMAEVKDSSSRRCGTLCRPRHGWSCNLLWDKVLSLRLSLTCVTHDALVYCKWLFSTLLTFLFYFLIVVFVCDT